MLFNTLTGYGVAPEYERLLVAPEQMRARLIELVRNEATYGEQGRIVAKMNSLVDPIMIDEFYGASKSNVPVDLIVRGICCLRPGVPGLSENIRVKSVVGRYLEHSRIACFGAGHGLPHENAKVFISSADWMDRNLNRRVETLCPIENMTVKKQVLAQVMAANMRDEANSWVMRWDGSVTRGHVPEGHAAFDCHTFFAKTPSLSGRGRAGTDDVSAPSRRG